MIKIPTACRTCGAAGKAVADAAEAYRNAVRVLGACHAPPRPHENRPGGTCSSAPAARSWSRERTSGHRLTSASTGGPLEGPEYHLEEDWSLSDGPAQRDRGSDDPQGGA